MRVLLVLCFCLSISQFVLSQTDRERDSLIVVQLVTDEFQNIWSNLDTSKLSVYHTDDFLLLEHGEIWTNDTIKAYQTAYLRNPDRPERINRFDFFDVIRSGNTIYASYHNYARFLKAGEEVFSMHWLESVVAVKTKRVGN